MDIEIPTTVDLRKYIDTQYFGARPHIRGRRVPVGLMMRFIRANNWSIEDTMYNLSLTEAVVFEGRSTIENIKKKSTNRRRKTSASKRK
jgi:uncharacterized protein (DUF433 family)